MNSKLFSHYRMLRWKLARRLSDQRGAMLVLVAVSMAALTSAVALAIDVGMLATARTEAQRAADNAALAGAGGLVQSPNNAALARSLAIQFGDLNEVRHRDVQVLPEDVDVDLAEALVTVRVYRTAERGNPVGTFFARVFGVDAVDVSTHAVAEAAPAGGVNCLLPVAIPDRWLEAETPGNDPDEFNEEMGDIYIPWVQLGSDPVVFNEYFTGYSAADQGHRMVIKSNGGGGGMNPSWYYPWRPWEDTGAEDFRTNIRECVNPELAFGVGSVVDTEPGNMNGPTLQGFQDLIDSDPSASWNDVNGCIVDRGLEFSSEVSHCRQSGRVRPIPMFDPTESPDPGNQPFTFTNFAGIFVEAIEGPNVIARWIGYSGVKPAGPGEGPGAGPLFKVVRLVE